MSTFRANLYRATFGNFFYLFSQWAVLVILTKHVSPAQVGEFSLALAITAPVILFCNLQLAMLQMTNTDEKLRFSDFLGTRLLTSALGFSGLIVFAALSHYDTGIKWLIIVMALAKSIESVSDIIFGLFQRHERLDYTLYSFVIKGLLSMGAVAVAVRASASMVSVGAALAIVWGFTLVAWDLPRAARLGGRKGPGLGRARQLLLTALPLGGAYALSSFSVNIPRYFLEHYHGVRALGIYATIAYFMAPVAQIGNALGQSTSARLAVTYSSGDWPGFVRLSLKVCAVAAGTGLCGILGAAVLGRPILTLFYGPAYASYPMVLILTMVAGMVGSVATAVWNILVAMRLLRVQLPVYLLASICTAGACVALIPRYEATGAAWATVALYVAQLAGLLIALGVAAAARPERGRVPA